MKDKYNRVRVPCQVFCVNDGCMYVYQKLGQLHQGGIRDQHLSVQISLASNSGKS